MQENNSPQPVFQPTPVEQNIGFPSPRQENEKKGGFVKWIIAGVGILAIVIGGAFFVMSSPSDETTNSTPTPTGNVLSTFPTPEVAATPEPTVTPTPQPVDKSEVKIEILNGTGKAGEASFVKAALEKLDFTEIEAANAESRDETSTTVTYSSSLPQSLVDEIVSMLEKSFADVKARKGTVSGGFDIRILTGPRGTTTADATATPKSTATAKATSTPAAE